jgi:hypothetical protein
VAVSPFQQLQLFSASAVFVFGFAVHQNQVFAVANHMAIARRLAVRNQTPFCLAPTTNHSVSPLLLSEHTPLHLP